VFEWALTGEVTGDALHINVVMNLDMD
jgi:hypothetical protein